MGEGRGTAGRLTTEGHGPAATGHLVEVGRAGAVPRGTSEAGPSHTGAEWG